MEASVNNEQQPLWVIPCRSKDFDVEEPQPDNEVQILKDDSMRSALLWLRPQSAMRSSLWA